MTHIVHGVTTKKQLKAAAKWADNAVSDIPWWHTQGFRGTHQVPSENAVFDAVYFEDPSLFSPQSFSFMTMPVGMTIVTRHPKRSWFAKVTRVDASTWRVT